MSVFHYQNNILHIESMSTRVLALDYGTPLYVYSRQAIEQAWHGYADTLGDRGLVCYAVKANSNLAVLNILARLGSGFDIVSIGELERVLAAGGQADRVVFSGVAKQADDLKRALQVGIRCFNVESLAELRVLNTVAGVGKISMDEVTRGVMPFMLAQFTIMFAMVAFPALVMVPARWFY